MMKVRQFFCLALFVMAGCDDKSETIIHQNIAESTPAEFDWDIPLSIPLPATPDDNPMSEAKFQLGRHLFFDKRLSGNGTQSCGSCHEQDKAFTDGEVLPEGSTGDIHPRNSQALVNVAYNSTLTWANPSLRQIEKQILGPLFGESPVEQGITDVLLPEVIQRLKDEPKYAELFLAAFPDAEEPFTVEQITKSIAVFVRAMTSFNSRFDEFERGNITALSTSELRGRDLFFSEDLECFHCHGGYNFSDSTVDSTMAFVEKPFHNTGLFNIDGNGSYPDDNQGIFEITGNAQDMGKFRAVTLRNIEVTAPYMHDGSIATLEEVINFYAAGGRHITEGEHQGDGRKNPFKDSFVSGFDITEEEKQDVINFLKSLTDNQFLTNPRFSDPWISQ